MMGVIMRLWVKRLDAAGIKRLLQAIRDRSDLPRQLADVAGEGTLPLAVKLLAWRARSLPPDEGLRLLLSLDSRLYPLLNELCIAKGGGLHVKLGYMAYEQFFVRRIASEDRVLDIGCGLAVVARAVAEQAGAQVVAIDLDESKIRQARELHPHPRIDYRVGNALTDLRDERFDVVILSNVLEHLPGRPEFLRRVVALSRPKRLLIRVPSFEREWRVPLKRDLGVEWRLDPTHETEYTLESFAAEMREARLRVTHLESRWGELWVEVIPEAGF